MPAPPRYRLEAAESARNAAKAAAEGEFSRAHEELARALALAEQAQRELEQHEARAPDEPAGVAGQAVRALDLQRAAAFAARHTETTRALRDARARAGERVGEHERTLERCRAALAAAHAGARVLERDRERFERMQRKQAEEAEQRELEEQRLGTPGDRRRDRC